ncbi:MAG: hypothetical protein SFY66_18485 [Oculatellaceae cyanobacterium bins.114]|nr:hypothetical protein [Oculatellaceae cyanobacterium bins.114]
MTQTSDTNSRIARLEALMLEIAASNLRHERTNDNQSEALATLSEGVARHEQRIAEHEEWQRQQEAAIARHNEWQAAHERRITEHEEWQAEQEAATQRHTERMERIEAQQEVNMQAIAQLTAGLVELRNLVTDYLKGRSNLG